MTKISAEIIADSLNEFGDRLTTMIVTFPRIILAEFNTHRVFSRNSASSRAIPFEKMVKSVQENPFIPIAWQKDHKGMQGIDYITDEQNLKVIKEDWLNAKDNAIWSATDLHKGFNKKDNFGHWLPTENDEFIDKVTKQLCNRLLEPFMWHTVIVTSSEWENFFNLRCPQYVDETGNVYRSKIDFINNTLDPTQGWMVDRHSTKWFLINKGAAEIHMMQLAECMWDAYNESKPKELKAGEWHIPFSDDLENVGLGGGMHVQSMTHQLQTILERKIKVAVARCARVSYTVVGEEGKEPNYENDIKLHDILAKNGHASPFEHCAKAMNIEDYRSNINGKIKLINDSDFQTEFSAKTGYTPLSGACENEALGWCRNFKGFIQYRELLENNKTF